MENLEEILHSLEEFSKLRPKDIPHELEEYLCFVAKTGDPVYQWSSIKSLFREKLINVINEFYESCPSMDIPPCPNVEMFNYETMKSFILEKLDTFSAAPFTVQRICELLTTPRKEYNRIDKYMRALEKNILVVSTVEPRDRRLNHENADGVVNGLEGEHGNDGTQPTGDEEMEDMYAWTKMPSHHESGFQNSENGAQTTTSETFSNDVVHSSEEQQPTCSSVQETTTSSTTLSCSNTEQQPYVSIEPVVASDGCSRQENTIETENVSVTITAIPAVGGVQKRRSSIEATPVAAADAISVAQASTQTLSEADLKNETTEESTPSASDETTTTEKADSTSSCQQEPENSVITNEDETKETTNEAVVVEISQPEQEEKPCESSTETADEVSSTDKVVEATEPKEIDLSVITSSEEVTNEATTSDDKIDAIEEVEEEEDIDGVEIPQNDETDEIETPAGEEIIEKSTETDQANVEETDSVAEAALAPVVADASPMEIDESENLLQKTESTAVSTETSTS